ncbi:MAG: hypothetical protein CM15mP114_10800 [Alphaproteobacteria bacterium]|nr:MAG: hypothetical protein CM15mP114_10800 [Alphaproteobacteria bacterium]
MKSAASKPSAVDSPVNNIMRVSPVLTAPLLSSSITTSVLPSPLKLYSAYISMDVVGNEASASVMNAAILALPAIVGLQHNYLR